MRSRGRWQEVMKRIAVLGNTMRHPAFGLVTLIDLRPSCCFEQVLARQVKTGTLVRVHLPLLTYA